MAIRFSDVEVDGRATDVVVDGDRIAAVGMTRDVSDTSRVTSRVVDGRGGALIPGLWDHHLHLLATAAAADSVTVGPPDVVDADGLHRTLAAAEGSVPAGRWIRAVGYHESVAGPLDRHDLDPWCDRPLRIQHRSGARWILNSAACRAVDLDGGDHPGIERHVDGTASGVITGADAWLRDRIGTDARGDLAALGRWLSSYGVVGVTDATPDDDTSRWRLLARAAATGELPQHVVVMGGPPLAPASPPDELTVGPVKIYLGDDRLPPLDDVVAWIVNARTAGRTVAFHSVTRTTLAFAVAALDGADAGSGCRIEHGSVIDPGLLDELVRLGVTVVTQPSFVAERGDDYLSDVVDDDRAHLYRCATLRSAGVPVAGSTDAPYGSLDPWAAIRAAVGRRTRTGAVVGSDERLAPSEALSLFLAPPDDPGGPPRRVAPGQAANLCLLDAPLVDVLRAPSADHVRMTLISGRIVHDRDSRPENATRVGEDYGSRRV